MYILNCFNFLGAPKHFLLGKEHPRRMRKFYKFLLEHFKGTKTMTREHGGNRLRCLSEISGLDLGKDGSTGASGPLLFTHKNKIFVCKQHISNVQLGVQVDTKKPTLLYKRRVLLWYFHQVSTKTIS